jgi:microsomal dipeptidase-like Zn-dependent dipeptidase
MESKSRLACLILGLVLLLSQCDNVLNRAKVPRYQGHYTSEQLKVGDNGCSTETLESGNAYRLLTEQEIFLRTSQSLVLEQVVPNISDTLFLDFVASSGHFDFSQLAISACVINEAGETRQIATKPELRLSDDKQDLLARISLKGLSKNRLLLSIVFPEEKKQSHLSFKLDTKISSNEGAAWQPVDRRTKQSPAKGFLDLHLHQTGAMAFNQGWYWGSHEVGNLQEMLSDCQGEHASMFEFEHVLDGKVTGPIAYAIAPKRDVDDFMRSHRDMTSAKDYVRSNDRKHQQVAYQRLKEAHERGLSLIISTVVENNVLLDIMKGANKGRSDWYPSVMESIKRQIYSLHEIDAESDWFEIVYDPWHARRAINEGKLAVVIGAEFTDIFPPSDGPWEQQLHDLYAMGLRHLQPVHKSDSQFSSTHNQGFPFDNLNLPRAFVRAEIPEWPAILRTLGQDDPEVGMTQRGFSLLDEMVDLNMIIDLSHASLVSQREMTDYLLQEKNYYPFIYSHWSARSPELLDKLKLAGGMIPFGWGQPVPESQHVFETDNSLSCKDFVKQRADLYQRYIDYGINFSFATDMNGFTSTVQPNFGPKYCELDEPVTDRSDQTQTWERMKDIYPQHPEWVNRYWAQGTADISLLPGLVYDLKEVLGVDTSVIENSTENFIKMWERTYDDKRQAVEN